MRVFKVLAVLVLAVVIGLVAYAYLGDMEAIQQEIRVPVTSGGSGG